MTTECPKDVYTVTIARHGSRMATRSDVFLNYSHYGTPDSPMQMDYFIWVIKNHERTILVDTGYSLAGAENRKRDVLVEVPTLLSQLGVDCNDVPLIIASHAHYDHIGNLDAFPNAQVIIAQAELDFWNSPNAHKPLFCHSIEQSEIATLNGLFASGRLETFSGTSTPVPGVELIEVGGHTPGQTIVLVQTVAGPVLLTSDAMHYYEELEGDMPFTSVTDVVGMYDAFEQIRGLLKSGRAQHLVSGHDPSTLTRFTPIPGFEGTAAVIG